MPVTVVVGGQFGSEGKGKIAHFLAKETAASIAIRVGGPNSGHTVVSEFGETLIFRQLPTASILPDVICVLPAGSYIYPRLLLNEIAVAKLPPSRLLIDPNALVIDEDDIEEEKRLGLKETIASTGSGTGAAVTRRIERRDASHLARTHPLLSPYIQDANSCIRTHLNRSERIIVEGTQGFGLSILHSPHYPYVTSRDTTAANFIAEAGLSPLDVDDVVMVMRAHPIRVGGNSGPLANETSWAAIAREGGHSTPLIEFTTVTKTIRRVANFDASIVQRAIRHKSPTRLVLNHIDYIDANAWTNSVLSRPAIQFVRRIETELNRPIDLIGLGPDTILDVRAHFRVGSIR